MDEKLLEVFSGVFNYAPSDVIVNAVLAFILGMIISFLYKKTHQGLSYSQSFVLTLIFVTVIISIVVMVIGNSITRAFALVGALSIIRFRTVVKDTKDTAYVFMALAIGMAAGTASYFIAIFSTFFMYLIAWLLFKFNYGIKRPSDFILRFYYDKNFSELYLEKINQAAEISALLHIEPSGDGNNLHLTYDLSLKENIEVPVFISEFANIEGISEVVLISSTNDVDY